MYVCVLPILLNAVKYVLSSLCPGSGHACPLALRMLSPVKRELNEGITETVPIDSRVGPNTVINGARTLGREAITGTPKEGLPAVDATLSSSTE